MEHMALFSWKLEFELGKKQNTVLNCLNKAVLVPMVQCTLATLIKLMGITFLHKAVCAILSAPRAPRDTNFLKSSTQLHC